MVVVTRCRLGYSLCVFFGALCAFCLMDSLQILLLIYPLQGLAMIIGLENALH